MTPRIPVPRGNMPTIPAITRSMKEKIRMYAKNTVAWSPRPGIRFMFSKSGSVISKSVMDGSEVNGRVKMMIRINTPIKAPNIRPGCTNKLTWFIIVGWVIKGC